MKVAAILTPPWDIDEEFRGCIPCVVKRETFTIAYVYGDNCELWAKGLVETILEKKKFEQIYIYLMESPFFFATPRVYDEC